VWGLREDVKESARVAAEGRCGRSRSGQLGIITTGNTGGPGASEPWNQPPWMGGLHTAKTLRSGASSGLSRLATLGGWPTSARAGPIGSIPPHQTGHTAKPLQEVMLSKGRPQRRPETWKCLAVV
jgi:hypothetical protein